MSRTVLAWGRIACALRAGGKNAAPTPSDRCHALPGPRNSALHAPFAQATSRCCIRECVASVWCRGDAIHCQLWEISPPLQRFSIVLRFLRELLRYPAFLRERIE